MSFTHVDFALKWRDFVKSLKEFVDGVEFKYKHL